MTDEHPTRVCHDCQTPLGHRPDRIAGEFYCAECSIKAARRVYGE